MAARGGVARGRSRVGLDAPSGMGLGRFGKPALGRGSGVVWVFVVSGLVLEGVGAGTKPCILSSDASRRVLGSWLNGLRCPGGKSFSDTSSSKGAWLPDCQDGACCSVGASPRPNSSSKASASLSLK